MKIEFAPNKSTKNDEERGFSFELAAQFDFETAAIEIDNRKNYQEIRFNALGLIDDRLYHMTYTVREVIVRVISLRKANKIEVIHHAYHH